MVLIHTEFLCFSKLVIEPVEYLSKYTKICYNYKYNMQEAFSNLLDYGEFHADVQQLILDGETKDEIHVLMQLRKSQNWDMQLLDKALAILNPRYLFAAGGKGEEHKVKLGPNYSAVTFSGESNDQTQYKIIRTTEFFSSRLKIAIMDELFKDDSIAIFLLKSIDDGKDTKKPDWRVRYNLFVAAFYYRQISHQPLPLIMNSLVILLSSEDYTEEFVQWKRTLSNRKPAHNSDEFDQIISGLEHIIPIVKNRIGKLGTYVKTDEKISCTSTYLNELLDELVQNTFLQGKLEAKDPRIAELRKIMRSIIGNEDEYSTNRKFINSPKYITSNLLQSQMGQSATEVNTIESRYFHNRTTLTRKLKTILIDLLPNELDPIIPGHISKRTQSIFTHVGNHNPGHIKRDTMIQKLSMIIESGELTNTIINEFIYCLLQLSINPNTTPLSDDTESETPNNTHKIVTTHQVKDNKSHLRLVSDEELNGIKQRAKLINLRYAKHDLPFYREVYIENSLNRVIMIYNELLSQIHVIGQCIRIIEAIKSIKEKKFFERTGSQLNKKKEVLDISTRLLRTVSHILLIHFTSFPIPFVEFSNLLPEHMEDQQVAEIFEKIDSYDRLVQMVLKLSMKPSNVISSEIPGNYDEEPQNARFLMEVIHDDFDIAGFWARTEINTNLLSIANSNKPLITQIPKRGSSVRVKTSKYSPERIDQKHVAVSYLPQNFPQSQGLHLLPAPSNMTPLVIFDEDNSIDNTYLSYETLNGDGDGDFADQDLESQTPQLLIRTNNASSMITVVYAPMVENVALSGDAQFNSTVLDSTRLDSISSYSEVSKNFVNTEALQVIQSYQQYKGIDITNLEKASRRIVQALFPEEYHLPDNIQTLIDIAHQLTQEQLVSKNDTDHASDDLNYSNKYPELFDELLLYMMHYDNRSKRSNYISTHFDSSNWNETLPKLLEENEGNSNEDNNSEFIIENGLDKKSHVFALVYLYNTGRLNDDMLLTELSYFVDKYYEYDFGGGKDSLVQFLESNVGICNNTNIAISQLYSIITGNPSGQILGYVKKSDIILSTHYHRIMWAYDDENNEILVRDMTPTHGPGVQYLESLEDKYIENIEQQITPDAPTTSKHMSRIVISIPFGLISLLVGAKQMKKIQIKSDFISIVFENLNSLEIMKQSLLAKIMSSIDSKIESIILEILIDQQNHTKNSYQQLINYLCATYNNIAYSSGAQSSIPKIPESTLSAHINYTDARDMLRTIILKLVLNVDPENITQLLQSQDTPENPSNNQSQPFVPYANKNNWMDILLKQIQSGRNKITPELLDDLIQINDIYPHIRLLKLLLKIRT